MGHHHKRSPVEGLSVLYNAHHYKDLDKPKNFTARKKFRGIIISWVVAIKSQRTSIKYAYILIAHQKEN